MDSLGKARDGFRYSLVTPARNEEAIIAKTSKAIVEQSIQPLKWVILDDGSTDKTGEILDDLSRKYKWIETIHTDKTTASYKGVQEKLGIAFGRIQAEENDFIGKLDADIEVPGRYFEALMKKFHNDSTLGIAGGYLWHFSGPRKVFEGCPENHVRGGLKFYRTRCWLDIGGMEFKLGYDTIDEVKANMFGWRTRSFKDLMALHHRPTGRQKGYVGWYAYLGELHYMVGYHPIFLFFKALKDALEKPYLISGMAEIAGFLRCYVKGVERSIRDVQFISFLRKKQLERLRSKLRWR